LETIPGVGDFDLIWTMLEHGATVGIVEKRFYHYRDHAEERLTLADLTKSVRNLRKILRKHGVSNEEVNNIAKEQTPWYGRRSTK
jgi:hypothetical protein